MPSIQESMALSMLYFSVPGAIGSVGSAADGYSGDWWYVGPSPSQAPCMSYVMMFA